MSPATKHALTAVAAAATMYWFDPARGRRRRALLRDKFVSFAAEARDAASAAGRDMRHRLQGAAARTGSKIRSESADDNWPRTARLLAGATGASLTVWGVRRHPWIAFVAIAVAGAAMIRGWSNMPLQRFF